MSKKSTKNNGIFLIVMLVVVAVVLVPMLAKSGDGSSKLNSLSYEIGTLDETGEFVKDTSSIVTKKFIPVNDLEIELEKDAMVTYKVFWFDEDEEFISADSKENTDDYAGTIPETAEFCKIVITPTNDAEVGSLEIREYAGQVTVTYSSEKK